MCVCVGGVLSQEPSRWSWSAVLCAAERLRQLRADKGTLDLAPLS